MTGDETIALRRHHSSKFLLGSKEGEYDLSKLWILRLEAC
jgi:hypothetical protein